MTLVDTVLAELGSQRTTPKTQERNREEFLLLIGITPQYRQQVPLNKSYAAERSVLYKLPYNN